MVLDLHFCDFDQPKPKIYIHRLNTVNLEPCRYSSTGLQKIHSRFVLYKKYYYTIHVAMSNYSLHSYFCSFINLAVCNDTSMTHLAITLCASFLSSQHFDVICDQLVKRHAATRDLFVNLWTFLTVYIAFCSLKGTCQQTTRVKSAWSYRDLWCNIQGSQRWPHLHILWSCVIPLWRVWCRDMWHAKQQVELGRAGKGWCGARKRSMPSDSPSCHSVCPIHLYAKRIIPVLWNCILCCRIELYGICNPPYEGLL